VHSVINATTTATVAIGTIEPKGIKVGISGNDKGYVELDQNVL